MNVLVDGENNACLTDFGMTSVVGEVCTALEYLQTANVRRGAMMWAAPELFPNPDHPSHVPEATVKSDIYSLGSVIRFVLSGEPPWPPKVSDLEKKIREGEIPERPASLAPSAWNEIWTFIERCWSPHSPSIRPSAKEVLSFVSSFQPPPTPPRTPIQNSSAGIVAPPASAPNSLPDAPPDPALAPVPNFLRDAPPPSAPNSPAASPKTFNVVLFGEAGAGKSSVINLIAGKHLAETSPGANICTMDSTAYKVTLESWDFCLYDTVGLVDPDFGVNGYLGAIEKAVTLIRSLGAAGGVHLLLYCLRGGRITKTMQSHYRLFHEVLCDKKVPIALVVTHLENEVNMEDWWIQSESIIKKHGMDTIGYACITSAGDWTPYYKDKRMESQKKIRALLTEHAARSSAFQTESEDWLTVFLKRVTGSALVSSRPKRKVTAQYLVQRCGMDSMTAKRVAELVKRGELGEQASAG
ncbi:hypothetical protein HYDPIDRAFT_127534 [Hydnomerulius pinastri MD-312]|nr:hypothetical protein HYDPIDRAFT_127534 [Hydnomerulius pinastri MD-312]